jgi:hypothetical protein
MRTNRSLGEDAVEVLDELERACPQVLDGGEAGPLEKTASENREPDLDLVEPGAVTGV